MKSRRSRAENNSR